jgi:Helix-turn-helix domain
VTATRAAVKHDRRLAVLDFLDGQEAMTGTGLADALSWPLRTLRYHVARLDAHNVVKRNGVKKGPGVIERLYSVDLAEQPEWVREAVEDYRQRGNRE